MKIFINYRRAETDDLAGRLYDHLRSEFGSDSVFIDVDKIQSGEIWKARIERSLSDCDIVLSLIGQQWETCVDGAGLPRLQDDNDPVRYELEFARQKRKPILPILVKREDVPKDQALPAGLRWILAHNFTDLRGGTHFGDDVARLVLGLRQRRDDIEKENRRNQEALAAKHAKALESNAAAIACPNCRQICPRSDEFCEICGSNLWTECPKCRSRVAASQQYCRGCGVDIQKYREAARIVDDVRPRCDAATHQASAQERLQIANGLLSDVESALRIFPRFEPALDVKAKVKSLGLAAVLDIGEAAHATNRYAEALQAYEAAKVWGARPSQVERHVSQIREYRDSAQRQANSLVSHGELAKAMSVLTELESRFPGDADTTRRLADCKTAMQHLELLLTTKIRELKLQRKLIELEREVSWLEQKRIKIDRLPEFAKSVRLVLADANARFARAQAALSAGQIEEAMRLAMKVAASVADHQGALEMLSAARSGKNRVDELAELVNQEEWCTALDLLKDLDGASLTDSRIPKLRARITASIAGLDWSILFLAATAAVGVILALGLVPLLRYLEVTLSRSDATVLTCFAWAGAALMFGIAFLTLGQKPQVVRRFKMRFVQSRPASPLKTGGDAESLSPPGGASVDELPAVVPQAAGSPPPLGASNLFAPVIEAPLRSTDYVVPVSGRENTPGDGAAGSQMRLDESEFTPKSENSRRVSFDLGILDGIDRSLITFNWILVGGFGGAAAVLAWTWLTPSHWKYPWLLLAVVLTVIGLFPAVLVAGGRALARPALVISAIGVVVAPMSKMFDLPEGGGLALLVAYAGLAGASLIAQSLGQKFWKGMLAFVSTAALLAAAELILMLLLQALHEKAGFNYDPFSSTEPRKAEPYYAKPEDVFGPYLFTALMAVIVGTRGYWRLVLKCGVALSLWLLAVTMFAGTHWIGRLVLFVFVMQAILPLCTRKWRADLVFWAAGVAALVFGISRLWFLGNAARAPISWLAGWLILCCSVVIVLTDIADVPREYRRLVDRLRRNVSHQLERIHGWLSPARRP
jgi:tetratricopeptide (TPR) repeat protein